MTDITLLTRIMAGHDTDEAPSPPKPQGFTPELERICANCCADVGDVPCWSLPELVEPCEQITPCAECLAALGHGEGE